MLFTLIDLVLPFVFDINPALAFLFVLKALLTEVVAFATHVA